MFYIYANGQPLSYPLDKERVVIAPKMTLEMGKAGSLEFGLPPSNALYNDIQKLISVITVELDDVEIFRGRVLSYERTFNNVKNVYCEGNLAYLIDSVQKSEKYSGTTRAFFSRILSAHNASMDAEKRFALGNVTIEDRPIEISGKSDDIETDDGDFNYKQIAINSIVGEWKNTFDYISSCLLDYCGGYLRTRRVGDVTYLDYVLNYGNTAVQEIAFGVNMLDFLETVTAENAFSVLIPLGDDNLTIASVNDGSEELVDQAALAICGGRIIKTHVFSNVTEAATLLENGRRFLASHTNIPSTFSIRAVDLHLVNPEMQEIYVGDSVHVKSAPHSLIDYLTCTKIDYDFENPGNTIYTFGVPMQSLTERYKEDKKKSENNESETASAAAGGAGGGAGDNTEEQINEFEKSWVNWDPNVAKVDIGTFYKQVQAANQTLLVQCGIDVLGKPEGGVQPNVNIHFMENTLGEHDSLISQNASNIILNKQGIKLHTEQIEANVKKEAEIELTIARVKNELISQINLKADEVNIQDQINGVTSNIATISRKVTNINSDITNINSEITNVKTLIAEQIDATKADIDWLRTKSINSDVGVYAPYIRASKEASVAGKVVATREWVEGLGYTNNSCSWGNVNNGFVFLNINGSTKYLAMGNHSHSGYLTSLPSHRHYFSGSCNISIGHAHYVYKTGQNTGGMSTNSSKTVSISGYTNYSP